MKVLMKKKITITVQALHLPGTVETRRMKGMKS
jgi:hypothetical protein